MGVLLSLVSHQYQRFFIEMRNRWCVIWYFFWSDFYQFTYSQKIIPSDLLRTLSYDLFKLGYYHMTQCLTISILFRFDHRFWHFCQPLRSSQRNRISEHGSDGVDYKWRFQYGGRLLLRRIGLHDQENGSWLRLHYGLIWPFFGLHSIVGGVHNR